MSTTIKWITGLAGASLLAALVIFIFLTLPRMPEDVTTEHQEETRAPDTLQEIAAEPSPTPFEAVLVEEVIITPLPTPKELPTPIPTDILTPLPVSEPPLIPEATEKEEQLFWIYYWEDNEVWRIDSQGNDPEILLDTQEALGEWLTDHPVPNSDCCWSGPRVVISPDGGKLALVVVDKINISESNEPFNFSIYIFDLASRNLQLIGTGVQPVWSSDSTHIAFLDENTLYISDVSNGASQAVASSEEDAIISEYAWSTDGQQIAYTLNQGSQRLPMIWTTNVDADESPVQLAELTLANPPYRLAWLLDNDRLLFLSSEDSRDRYPQNRFQNIYSVSLQTQQLEPVTHDMVVQNYQISPEKQWLAISGYFPHEQSAESYHADIWLQNVDGIELKRATIDSSGLGIVGWTPDGTRLLLWQQDKDPAFLSLKDGSVTEVDFELPSDYAIGGLK